MTPILDRYGWTGPFIACGIGGMLCCIAMSGICFTCLKSTHGTVVASSVSSINTDSSVSKQTSVADNEKEENGSSQKRNSFQMVKCVALMVSNMLTYFVFKGMYDWTGKKIASKDVMYLHHLSTYSTTDYYVRVVLDRTIACQLSACVGADAMERGK